MKRILKVFVVLLSLILFTSCTLPGTQGQVKSYSIKYYVEGILVESDSYVTGETPDLYVYQLNPEDNAVFDGWYDNQAYTGQKIESISSESSGDLCLYGRIVENKDDSLEALKKALNISNYTYEIEQTEGSLIYEVSSNGIKMSGSFFGEYPYYLDTTENKDKIVYNYNNNWYYSCEGENIYLSFIDYFNALDLSAIDSNKFEYSSNIGYSVKDEYLNEVYYAYNPLADNVECESFVIELNENNQLSQISLTLKYNSSTENEYVKYNNINNTSFIVPSATYDNGVMGGVVQATGIDELYYLSSGDDAYAKGVVTGCYGNNFYISDNSGSILVYCGNDSTYTTIVEDGAAIEVYGTISVYKDIVQIQNVTSISLVNDSINVSAKELSDVSQSKLATIPAEYVSVKKATLLNVPTYSSNDMSFDIRVNNVEVTVFISRHLSSTVKNQIINTLSVIGANNKIDIQNLHVSKYNEYQLVCTSVTNVVRNTDALVLTGITASPSKVSVEEGSTIDDVLESVSLYKIFDDSSNVSLNVKETTYNTNFVENKIGTYYITFIYNLLTVDVTIEVYEKGLGYIETEVTTAPNKEAARNLNLTTGLPSIGNPKVLVIPITFIDYPASNSLVNDLQKAFFGTSEETGWESLQSYYYKSSYGKLNITGTVLQPYKTNNYASYYNSNESADYDMIEAALKYYDDQIDYSEYDTDNDGYIDSLYIVYTRDYDNSGDSNWWAYTYEYYTNDYQYYDGVEADFYVFMSCQFIYDQLQGKNVKYNAETIIHETGHLLGLDDYYDYTQGTGPEGGIGGGDMMDYNVGDHNAFSKLLLGWVNPYVLTGSNVNISLKGFAASGECIIVPKNWNGSFYSEYFIIDYYTPTGVNSFVKGESGLFATYGVRIYHINAELLTYSDAQAIYAMTKYNNTDTTYRLISLIEADGKNDIANMGWSEDSDLFQAGTTYSSAKWCNNTSANFTMKVNSIVTTTNNEVAQITFTFK